MTVSGLTIQSVLLRIAPTTPQSQYSASVSVFDYNPHSSKQLEAWTSYRNEPLSGLKPGVSGLWHSWHLPLARPAYAERASALLREAIHPEP